MRERHVDKDPYGQPGSQDRTAAASKPEVWRVPPPRRGERRKGRGWLWALLALCNLVRERRGR